MGLPAADRGPAPTTYQMLYRFDQATTARQITADTAAVTAGLPSGSLVAHQSYLTLKAQVAAQPNAFVPLLHGLRDPRPAGGGPHRGRCG